MKFEVRYYSKGGNTRKVAEAIAEGLEVKAESVEKPLDEKTDVLVMCDSVYAAGVSVNVKKFLKENKDKIGELVNASTAALLESTYSQMKKITAEEGIKLSDREFHCRGQFLSVHKGHPDANDLENAKKFGMQLKESAK